MKKIDAKELLEKYSSGKCSEQERAMVETWYLENYNVQGNFTITQLEKDKEETLVKILQAEPKRKSILWFKVLSAAALILMISSIGLYFYQKNNIITAPENDLIPGGNIAYLTLANGKRINLSQAKNGELAEHSGIKITKAEDGKLLYKITSPATASNDQKELNTIETPKGGQYQITLPDGTRVWLNAASSLKYPMLFATSDRKVELSGEAYFEVSKDKKRPFIVTTAQQKIKVLGTHFNINSYANEASTKTTLFEGSVRVTLNSLSRLKEGEIDNMHEESVLLKPGQQSLIRAHHLQVSTVDLEEAKAWKDGFFYFNDTDLEDVMRQLARWYNVDIAYEGKIPQRSFTGKLYRNVNASQILEILKYKKINYLIRDKKIIITN